MSGLATVIEELLVTTIVSEKILLPRTGMMDWALRALSVLLGGAGVFLSILGLNRFLEGKYTADVAVLISAAVVFIAAYMAAALAGRIRRQKARSLRVARDEIGKNIRSLIEGACDELDEPVRENPKTAVLLATMAGFLTAQHRA